MVAFFLTPTFVVYVVLLSILSCLVESFACMLFSMPRILLFSYDVYRLYIRSATDCLRSDASANEGPKAVGGNESDQSIGDGKYGDVHRNPSWQSGSH